MPIGTLRFNLPEEGVEFLTAQRAQAWKGIVEDLDQWLRNEIKYSDQGAEERLAIFQEARDKLWSFLQDNELSIL